MPDKNPRQPTQVPTFEVVEAVAEAPYPARRDALAQHASGKRAPEEVIESLRRLPDREYADADEVENAYAEFSQRGGS